MGQVQAQGLGWDDPNVGQGRPGGNKVCCWGALGRCVNWWAIGTALVQMCQNWAFHGLYCCSKCWQQKWICLGFLFHWQMLKKKETYFWLYLIYFFPPSQCCFHFRCRGQLWHNPTRNNIGDHSIIISLCIFIAELFQFQLWCFTHLTSCLHFIA